jgi:hypothetical protein
MCVWDSNSNLLISLLTPSVVHKIKFLFIFEILIIYISIFMLLMSSLWFLGVESELVFFLHDKNFISLIIMAIRSVHTAII